MAPALVVLGPVGLAAAVLVAALSVAGGAPQPAPPGLPDPGPFTGWTLPAVRLAADVTGAAVIGLLMLPALLLGPSEPASGHAVRLAARWTGATVLAVGAQILLSASDVTGRPVLAGLSGPDLALFIAVTPQGWACVAQLVVAAGLAVALTLLTRGRLRRFTEWHALVGALALVALPALVGHSTTSNQHAAAAAFLVAHVVAAALWVGGLAVLLWLWWRSPAVLSDATARFSPLALRCAATIAVTGPIAGVLHVGWVALVTTGYGLLLVAKAVVLAFLVGGGWLHRRFSLPALATAAADRAAGVERHGLGRAFARLAGAELIIMGVALGVAVALSRSPVQP